MAAVVLCLVKLPNGVLPPEPFVLSWEKPLLLELYPESWNLCAKYGLLLGSMSMDGEVLRRLARDSP